MRYNIHAEMLQFVEGRNSMSSKDSLSRCPKQLQVSNKQADMLYICKRNYYAVHDRQLGELAQGAVALFNEGRIAVFQGDPTATNTSQHECIGPVYALQPSEALAVPTGQVLVRFTEGVPAAAYTTEIEQAGYQLVESLSYAPHAAWVCARSGEIADALSHLSELERMPDVANVEPQMLMERAKR